MNQGILSKDKNRRSPPFVDYGSALGGGYWLARAINLLSLNNVNPGSNFAWHFDDFLSSSGAATQAINWQALLINTGAQAFASINDEGGGVHEISTGAGANSISFHTTNGSAIRNVKTTPWWIGHRMKITTAVDAVTHLVSGIVDSALGNTITAGFDGIYNAANYIFQYDGLEAFLGGSFFDTGVAVDLNTYHIFEIVSPGNNQLKLIMDGVLKGTVTMVAEPADSFYGYRVARNEASLANRACRFDWHGMLVART